VQLRPYQKTALNKILHDLKTQQNILLSAIMGAGKTGMVCTLIERLYKITDKRILILAHKQELVQQFFNTFDTMTSLSVNDIGICCAGLNEKNINRRVTIGTIQTFINMKDRYEWCDLLVIDEAHRISIGTDSQYDQVISHLTLQRQNMRVLGITATPFRLDFGYIYGSKHRPDGQTLFPKINYHIGYEELKTERYLMPLKGMVAMADSLPGDLESVTKHGDYVIDELGRIMCNEVHLDTAVEAIRKHCDGYKHVCVFCVTIDHAEQLNQLLGDESTIVHSQLTPLERQGNMAAWKDGRRRIITSVNILTEGFDFPPLDCLVFVRPTLSPGLFLQAVGRVLRICQGKEKAFLLDLTDNTSRFGTNLDNIKVVIPNGYTKAIEKNNEKLCPMCERVVHISLRICDCGFEWPQNECIIAEFIPEMKKVDFEPVPAEWKKVVEMEVGIHKAKKSGKELGYIQFYDNPFYGGNRISEWFCLPDYYGGYAVTKAKEKWKRYSQDTFPKTITEFLQAEIEKPTHILIDTNGEYPEIKDVKYQNCWHCDHFELDEDDFPASDFCEKGTCNEFSNILTSQQAN